jgi:hypothetical protein
MKFKEDTFFPSVPPEVPVPSPFLTISHTRNMSQKSNCILTYITELLFSGINRVDPLALNRKSMLRMGQLFRLKTEGGIVT